jgi:hypothetical protein
MASIFQKKPKNFEGYYEDQKGTRYTVVIWELLGTGQFKGISGTKNYNTSNTQLRLEDGSELLVINNYTFEIKGTGIHITKCKDQT